MGAVAVVVVRRGPVGRVVEGVHDAVLLDPSDEGMTSQGSRLSGRHGRGEAVDEPQLVLHSERADGLTTPARVQPRDDDPHPLGGVGRAEALLEVVGDVVAVAVTSRRTGGHGRRARRGSAGARAVVRDRAGEPGGED